LESGNPVRDQTKGALLNIAGARLLQTMENGGWGRNTSGIQGRSCSSEKGESPFDNPREKRGLGTRGKK